MKLDIIAISAKQGGGKSTLSNEVRKKIGEMANPKRWSVEEVIFAGPIYEMHNQVRHTARQYGLEVPSEKDGELLQYLGTEWGRSKFGQDVWAKAALNRIDTLEKMYRSLGVDRLTILIPDLRFKNEFHALPQAFRVRLSCPEEIRKTRATYWRENSTHASETDLDQYDSEGVFDLYANTAEISSPMIAARVLTNLIDGSWMRVRGDKSKDKFVSA